MRKRKPIFMCKEHHKEGCTLIAGTGEKNSCLTEQTENELKKAGQLFSRFSKYNPFTFLQFCLSFPFLDFLYSVWVLGVVAWSQVPQWGNKVETKNSARAKNLGRRSQPSLSLGRGRVAPFPVSQSTD